MARKPDKSTKGAALRAQADGLVQSSKRDVAAMPITDMQQLAHALQSKQIELARQHEKLRRTHIALQAARDRYKDLYDFSPIAHLTLDTSGTIWEANLSAATLLGPNRQELIGQPLARFVEPEHQAIFQRHCREVVKTGTRHTCEVRLRTETGPFCYVYLESVAMHEEPGPITHWRTALLDISERKQAEEMRAKFAALVEASDDAIIGKDLHGIITSWNQGAQQIFGYTEQEVIGRSISILIPPDHEDEEPYILDQMKRGEPLQHYETVRRRKDGSLIDISLTVSPIRDFEGRVIGGSKIARDITEWKRGQKALSASEARFRSLVSNLPGAVYRCACDPDWTMEFLSDPIEHLCGYPASDFLASRVRSFGSIIHPNDRPMVERVVLGAVSQRRPYAIEYRLLHKDGGIRWVYEKGRGVFAADGQVLWLDGAIFDVTERKISEDALRRSQEFITSVVESLPNMVFVKKADDLTLVRFNKAGEDLLGHSREVLIGKSDYDVFSKEKADYFTKKDRQALETGGLLNIPEEVIETKHQGLRILHTKKIPIYGETGEPQYLLGISEDITDRKQAEESLRKTKEQLQQALLASKIGLWDWNTDTNEVFFSREWKSQLGYGEEELANTFETWEALLHADDREKATAYVRSYVKNPVGDYEQEFRLRHKDGSYRWIAAVASFVLEPDGRRVRLSGSHKDITDTKRLEAQFLQGQKMEAVGQLAGGVAHDFNNLLTVINGYGALLLDQLPPEDSRHMMAAETVRAGKRAGQLTKQLLAFSRKQVLMLQPLNLNDSLQSIGSMLSRLLGEEVKLAMNLAPDLWSINGDTGQLNQVTMNLVINARDAMPHGGTVTIATRNVSMKSGRPDRHRMMPPGDYVHVSVRDTGHGMSPETVSHLFEPFFTTKEVGQGSGLGLATVYGIVKQSQGYIFVDSALNQGATFHLYYPRVMAAPAVTETPSVPHRRGSETLLVVEDQDMVRTFVAQALNSYGYRVIEAASGKEALRVAASLPEPVQALVTDVIMPQMSGPVLAQQLRLVWPCLRVLFMSGYTDRTEPVTLNEPGAAFIQKPFLPDALARQLRDLLDTSI